MSEDLTIFDNITKAVSFFRDVREEMTLDGKRRPNGNGRST
jgi:hypothetical protein